MTYQLLSGRLPYEAASLTELALKQQREAPAWLHELDPAIPEPLAVAVDRALSLDPAERPRDAEAMRQELLDGARGRGGSAAAAPTAATRIVAGAEPTSATRVAGDRSATADQPVAARVPRPAPPGRTVQAPARVAAPAPPARRPAREQRPARRRGGRIKRFFGILLVLLCSAPAPSSRSSRPRRTTARCGCAA